MMNDDDSNDIGVKLTKQQKRDKRRLFLKQQNNDSNVDNKFTSKQQQQQQQQQQQRQQQQNNNKKEAYKSVYRRQPCYPQSANNINDVPANRFIYPKDKVYNRILKTSYEGFEIDKKEAFDEKFHSDFSHALEDLDHKGIYQFDIIQPLGLGTKLSKTYVSRCLVGQPGITYKYQGLRMFSIPWTNDIGSTDATVSIGKLNDTLCKRTEFLLKKTKNGKDYGCCTYNLTLINRCYPDKTSDKYPKMKLEPTFNEEKITVSWHADSTLEHFSSIAVYQHTTDDDTTDDKDRWKLALRVHAHAEGPLQGKECKVEITAPPLAIPLPSNTCYYLLDEFNHHHQHSVLAGKSQRYSSTHRVAKVDGHTYQSIFAKCQSTLNNGSGYSGKQIRSEQLAFGELEFEWLRQFYIQGSKHKNKNVWWSQKMIDLLNLWKKFELKTMKSLEVLEDAVLLSQNNGIDDADSKQKIKKRKKRIATVDENSFNELIEGLKSRHEKRDGWIKRADDPIFKSEPIDCRPLRIPFDSEYHPDSDEAQKKLKESINKLLLLKQQYDLLGIGNKRKVDDDGDDINDQDETNETKVIKKSKH